MHRPTSMSLRYRSQFSLKISLFLAFFLQLLLLFVVFMTSSILVVSVFLVGVCILLALLFSQFRLVADRVLFVLGVSILPPYITIELADLSDYRTSNWTSIFLDSDRLNISVLCSLVLFLLLFFDAANMRVLLRGSRAKLFFATSLLSVSVFLWRFGDIYRVSLYQVVADYIIIIGSFSALMLLRSGHISIEKTMEGIESIMQVLILLLSVDFVLTLSNIAPWAHDYRGGASGTFFGTAGLYALLISMALVYVATAKRNRYIHWGLFSLVSLYILYSTQIKSSYGVLILMMSFFAMLRISGKNFGYFLLVVCIVGIVTGAIYVNDISEAIGDNLGSLMARVGSIVAPIGVFTDRISSVLFGLVPGVLTVNGQSNLAIIIFDQGRDSLFKNSDLGGYITREILGRAGRESGGEILPHVSPFTLLYAFGIVALPAIIYYWIYLPFSILKYQLFRKKEAVRVVACMYIFLVFYSLLHPFILLFPIVMFGWVISKALPKRDPMRTLNAGF